MKTTTAMNDKAIVSSKGQVVIPKSLRQALGIHAGTELIFELQEDDTLQVKPAKRSIEMLFGCCKEDNQPTLTVEEMDKAIMKAVLANDKPEGHVS